MSHSKALLVMVVSSDMCRNLSALTVLHFQFSTFNWSTVTWTLKASDLELWVSMIYTFGKKYITYANLNNKTHLNKIPSIILNTWAIVMGGTKYLIYPLFAFPMGHILQIHSSVSENICIVMIYYTQKVAYFWTFLSI